MQVVSHDNQYSVTAADGAGIRFLTQEFSAGKRQPGAFKTELGRFLPGLPHQLKVDDTAGSRATCACRPPRRAVWRPKLGGLSI